MIGRNLSSVSSLASDADGNVYLLNNGRLVRISADGVQRSVAANLTGLGWLVVDPHGTVFVADGHRVIRIYQPSGKQSVMGSVTSRTIEGLGVDSSGRPTVAFGYSGDNTSRWRPSRPPPGARRRSAPSPPSPTTESRARRLVEAPNGVIFIQHDDPGRLGRALVERINAGSSTSTMVNTRYSDYAWTVDPRTRLHLMQIRKWCFGAGRRRGHLHGGLRGGRDPGLPGHRRHPPLGADQQSEPAPRRDRRRCRPDHVRRRRCRTGPASPPPAAPRSPSSAAPTPA